MRSRGRTLALLVTFAASASAAWLSACGSDEPAPAARAESAAAAEPGADAGASSGSPAAASQAETPPRPRRRERPLPAFSGRTLAGEELAISSLIGKRLLLFFFEPEARGAGTVMEAVRNVAELRLDHNFQIVGVAMDSTRAQAREFVEAQGVSFPVLDDSASRIRRRLGLRADLLMIGVDSEGYVVFGIAHFPTEESDPVRLIEDQIRQALRLPRLASSAEPELGSRPAAPAFEAELLDREEPFSLADHRGEPVVVMFFLHTCPHCHEALRFFRDALGDLPEDSRPFFLGIEVSGRTADVRQRLRQDDIDFFPVAFDRDGSIQTAYGSRGSVPDIVLIDAEGRIAERSRGWRSREDPPLMRMRLAQLAGAPVPMLLRAEGYSGNEVCGVCHEQAYETWQFTRHAYAFDTLVEHGADTDPECIGCHVVGWGEPGGFVSASQTEDLEHVGCESCHGRGGPHLSPDFLPEDGSYESACVTCHDPKHSLGFEYASFLPRVSHAANAHLLALPLEEKRARLAELGAPREDLLPDFGDFVGSDACRSCHPAEYETWASQPHAHAVASLASQGEADNADCLACHTTGFGKPGGFPEDGEPDAHPDLARVGCESCHGAGGKHVEEGATKLGSILSLGDKCDSCVILQICGSCHDDANDPGFEFEVLSKIEAQRHGTIEAGTGRPLEGRDAARAAPAPPRAGDGPAAVAADVADAFRASERRRAQRLGG